MEEKWYEFWLASLEGISSQKKVRFREKGMSAKQLYNIEETEHLSLSEKEKFCIKESKKQKNWKETYEKTKEQGIRFVTAFDKEYPERLKNIHGMPYALFYKGEWIFEKEAVNIGMVGARRCSAYGETMTLKFAERLAELGIHIISGMARGVDGIAHRGALNVSGKTCAVLGCGVDVCYPKEHRGLYEDIAAHGCMLSEYPCGTAPLARNFPARNRIISGLSDLLLVMEAKEKSGSLITADLALEQGKDVYALPGNVENELSRGCNRLISQGAGILLGLEELIEELKLNGKISGKIGSQKEESDKKVLETEENLVYSCLGLYPKNREDILKETGLSPEQLMSTLVALELKGYITERSRNDYIRRK